MKYAMAVLAVLLLASSALALDVAPFAGVGIGRQPDGTPFNIGWMGGQVTASADGHTRLLATLNYGQFVAQDIDNFGGSLVLTSRWWTAEAPQPLIKWLDICLDVGFMNKFRDAGDGDRAMAFKVAPFISGKLTDTFSAQVGYCGFNSGPGMAFNSFWWGGLTASTNLVFGGAK